MKDKKSNKINKNLILMKINNHINTCTTINTNIPYNWPAFLAAS